MGKKKPPKSRKKSTGIICVPLLGPDGKITGSMATFDEKGYKQWLARQRAGGNPPQETPSLTEIGERLEKLMAPIRITVDKKPPHEESD